MYKIGELSRLCQIPVKTLRFYDAEGILVPDYIDEFTGYRFYDAAKLSDCYRIVALKELGFSLSEIKEFLSLPKEKVSELVTAKEAELNRLKAQTEARIRVLRNLNSALKESTCMFDIIIRKSDEIRLLFDRRVISSKSECEGVLKEIRNAIPKGLCGERSVIVDYETEFVSEKFDTGFGVELIGKVSNPGDFTEKVVRFSEDTAGLVCKAEEYDEAVRALHQYVLDNNYQIVGPTYQIRYGDGTVEVKLPVVKLHEFNPEFNEEIDLPFENDETVVGRWELLDHLPCKEMFLPEKRKALDHGDRVKELYFLPGGERYWCFGWTKGYVLSDCGYPHRKNQNPYTIERIGEETYLFLAFKGHNYFEGGKPEVWVFRKTDSKEYTKKEIRIVDEIPQVTADDSSVMGLWNVCDLVRSVESFDPRNTCAFIPHEALYWRSAEFLTGGQIRNGFLNSKDGSVTIDKNEVWRWVNGYVICNPRVTASKYVIETHEGTEYLFVQWKSGDYSYGGEQPFWYVFKR
ncbi:MAG: MerR family transcriptional regulator [Lachnospiraceae bacterium]|nr:MerR family transcriptional regulator [Lachnospiraceae bacterium]